MQIPNQKPVGEYTVNKTGGIEISSIKKDSSIFNLAQDCDADGNGVLENEEITGFLKKKGNNKETGQFIIYNDEYDENGKLHKRNMVMKHDNSQLSFIFGDNGEPLTCSIIKPNGERRVVYFEVKAESVYPDKNDPSKMKKFGLSDENLAKLRDLALGKEIKPEESLMQRIFNRFFK